ncbi:MAG: D-tyrosyl-tRNA(Tyr) deacylase [Lachnospiraceae bacterium]|nr:D-tyrosyl-tRNA(Tyr) deacylase [Lachnospiraceae bacterium]
MKFVIQRVLNAETTIIETDEAGAAREYVSGKIGKGYMVLCGIMDSDTVEIADKMVSKLIGLRIFEDENGKTNLDLKTVGGELMIVSQFTLCADTSHGNRPAFIAAARPEKAIPIYEHIIEECRRAGFNVQTGVFGADMRVELTNDGPFTIILDSDDLIKQSKH